MGFSPAPPSHSGRNESQTFLQSSPSRPATPFLLLQRQPRLVQLRALEFDWLCITAQWFPTLFFDSVPPAVALHLWDLIVFHGNSDGAGDEPKKDGPYQPDGGAPSLSPSFKVLAWVVLGLVELTADFLASCTSVQEVIILLRTAALELKHLDEIREV